MDEGDVVAVSRQTLGAPLQTRAELNLVAGGTRAAVAQAPLRAL